MSSGFNTDVRVGERAFHVQTEDRGPSHPVIDSAIYHSGHVLHRRSTVYEPAEYSGESGTNALRELVEAQHRGAIEDLRAGTLQAELTQAIEEAARAGGIQVQLLNPQSWLSAGNVALDVEILRKFDQQPLAGAHVEASIEGSLQDGRHSATSDQQGRVRIEFPLPPLGKGDLALVIRAKTDAAEHEIRFSMRSRQPAAPANSVQSS